jgi:putative hydrolase of the HAD superfamily
MAREEGTGVERGAGVVLDLFHTLVDPEEFRPPSFHRATYIAEALALDPVRFAAFWTASTAARNRHREPSVAERIARFCAEEGRPISAPQLAGVVHRMNQFQSEAIEHPHPWVLRELATLRARGYRLGLLSNADEAEVRAWPRSPLADCFDCVVFSSDIGSLKPEPEAYRAVLHGMGDVQPAHATFVGDGMSEELGGARRAGFGRVVFMRGFVAHNGLRTAAEVENLAREADLTIDRLDELHALLE